MPEGHTLHRLAREIDAAFGGRRVAVRSPQGRFAESAALVDGSVQVADIYTTSPAFGTEDLVILEDPELMISSQNIVPVMAEDVYSEELAEVLNAVSAELTTDDLIALRGRVEEGEKVSAEVAATDWLTEKGLI